MPNFVLAIAFLEANQTKAIKGLCGYARIAESEANAKTALKQLADETIKATLARQAREAAEGETSGSL